MKCRKQHLRRKPGIPDIPVGSFSDIAFLLIIFFILATTLTSLTGITSDIPAGQKSETLEQKTATLRLHADRILWNDQDIRIPQLREQLQALRLPDKPEAERVVILEASGDVPYQTYFDAMATVTRAGGVIAMVRESKRSEP